MLPAFGESAPAAAAVKDVPIAASQLSLRGTGIPRAAELLPLLPAEKQPPPEAGSESCLCSVSLKSELTGTEYPPMF